jgi:hypothetical protein
MGRFNTLITFDDSEFNGHGNFHLSSSGLISGMVGEEPFDKTGHSSQPVTGKLESRLTIFAGNVIRMYFEIFNEIIDHSLSSVFVTV